MTQPGQRTEVDPAGETGPAGVAPGRPPAGRRRRRWLLALRLAVSIALVWFLVRRIAGVAFADVMPPWSDVSPAWAAAALAMTAGSVVLAAARWGRVLTAIEMAAVPPLHRLTGHYFAGQFVSNVLPTTIGGDVVRAARLSGDAGDTAGSFSSVVIERLTGWLVLPALTLVGLALSPDVRATGEPAVAAAGIAVATLAGLAVIVTVAAHPRLGGRFAAGNRDAGWRRFLDGVHLGIVRLRRHPSAALGIVSVGLAYQLVLVGAAMAGARAIGVDVAAAALMAVFPIVFMAQVLPVAISGIGVREGALVVLLGPLGVADERAVALGLTVFALNLAVSLLGAPAFLAGSRRAGS